MKKALVLDGTIVQISDEEFPVAPPLTWVDAPDDADTHTHIYADGKVMLKPVPQQTPEQIIADYASRIQRRLDAFARTRGYDNILSACTYANSTVPQFAAEGKYVMEARDSTWVAAISILEAVQSGARPMPTWDEVEAELPALMWPA